MQCLSASQCRGSPQGADGGRKDANIAHAARAGWNVAAAGEPEADRLNDITCNFRNVIALSGVNCNVFTVISILGL